MSVVLITHDLGVVSEYSDRVAVMYAGQIVEQGRTAEVIRSPRHPYTRGLLNSIPRLSRQRQRIRPIEGQMPDLVDLPPQCRFYARCPDRIAACRAPIAMREHRDGHRCAACAPRTRRDAAPAHRGPGEALHPVPQPRRPARRRAADEVHAVNGVSLDIAPGETLGLIGESGCGKSTLGRVILRLHEPTSGRIHLRRQDVTRLGPEAMKAMRQKMQIVFQDPYASLNPRRTVEQIVGLPLRLHGLATGRQELRDRVARMVENVGLKTAAISSAIRTSSPAASASASASPAR
jgi:peptide/nickel transport system ATP-binding protein